MKLEWKYIILGTILFLLIGALGLAALVPVGPQPRVVTLVPLATPTWPETWAPTLAAPFRAIVTVEVTRIVVVTATPQPAVAPTNTPAGEDPVWWSITDRRLYLLTNLEIPADKWVGVRLTNQEGEEWYIGDTRSNRPLVYRRETQVEQDWYTGKKIPAGTYTAEIYICDELVSGTWDGTPRQPERVNFKLLGQTTIDIPK